MSLNLDQDRIQALKLEYTDQYVVVDSARPELARFKGKTGRVITINWNGRALVQFDGGADRGWYDIDLDDLRVVSPPEDESQSGTKAGEGHAREPVQQREFKPSALEVARQARTSRAESKSESAPSNPPPAKSQEG